MDLRRLNFCKTLLIKDRFCISTNTRLSINECWMYPVWKWLISPLRLFVYISLSSSLSLSESVELSLFFYILVEIKMVFDSFLSASFSFICRWRTMSWRCIVGKAHLLSRVLRWHWLFSPDRRDAFHSHHYQICLSLQRAANVAWHVGIRINTYCLCWFWEWLATRIMSCHPPILPVGSKVTAYMKLLDGYLLLFAPSLTPVPSLSLT